MSWSSTPYQDAVEEPRPDAAAASVQATDSNDPPITAVADDHAPAITAADTVEGPP